MVTQVKKIPKKYLIPWEPPQHGCLVKWRGRIEKARKRGSFTKQDQYDASEWNACAMGEAYRYFDGLTADKKGYTPRDWELEQLGVDFAEAVQSPGAPRCGNDPCQICDRSEPPNPKDAL